MLKIKFNKKSLKIKTLITLQKKLILSKYIIINNLNNFNFESLKLDLILNAKLINTAQSRILQLPFSGITKIIYFLNLIDLKNKLNLLLNNKKFFDIIGIKLNTKFYLISKFQKIFKKKNFIFLKKDFILQNLLNYNFNNIFCFQKIFLNLIQNFIFIILNNKKN